MDADLLPENVRTREIVKGVRLQLAEFLPPLPGEVGVRETIAAPRCFEILEEVERRIIVDMLERTNWNQTEAAERFQIPLSTLNQKIKRLGIETRRRNPPPRAPFDDDATNGFPPANRGIAGPGTAPPIAAPPSTVLAECEARPQDEPPPAHNRTPTPRRSLEHHNSLACFLSRRPKKITCSNTPQTHRTQPSTPTRRSHSSPHAATTQLRFTLSARHSRHRLHKRLPLRRHVANLIRASVLAERFAAPTADPYSSAKS